MIFRRYVFFQVQFLVGFCSTPSAWFISYREIEKIINFCLYAVRRNTCPPMAEIHMGLLLAGNQALVPSGPALELGNPALVPSGPAHEFGDWALVPSGLALKSGNLAPIHGGPEVPSAFGKVLSAFGKTLPAFGDVSLVFGKVLSSFGKVLSATGKKSLCLSTCF